MPDEDKTCGLFSFKTKLLHHMHTKNRASHVGILMLAETRFQRNK